MNRLLLDPSSSGGGGGSTSGGFGAGLVGGGLAGLISAPFNIYGSLEEQKSMNDAIQAELDRQKNYGIAGEGIFQQHLKENSLPEVNKNIQAGTKEAAVGYAGAPIIAQPNHGGLPTLGSSFMSPLTMGADKVSNNNAAQAQGYTDWGVKQALENLKARTRLNQNNQFSQASERVLPSEIGAAQQSQEGLKAFGSILGDVGGIAAMAAI